MKYLFILGRNPRLSVEEILSFFNVKDFSVKENAMLAELDGEIPKDILKTLGGTIAIGKILASGKMPEIKKQLDKIEVYNGESNKFNYVLWGFSSEENYDEILSCLKKRFREESLKPTRKNLTERLSLQSGEEVSIAGNNIDEEYFIFSNEEEDFFGRVIEKTEPEEIEERDMNKPVRRQHLAISPRLAKIMINLSRVSSEGTLIDPFCGIGIVLQEALLQDISVIGVDKDADAIEGARQNLKWKKFSENNYQLIKSDSTKVITRSADVLVSEPDLGMTLRKSPTKEKAAEMLERYEYIVARVLQNLRGKVRGRIVITAPYIKLHDKKRVGPSLGRIQAQAGLRLHKNFPIPEFRESQIVGRQILVFEK